MPPIDGDHQVQQRRRPKTIAVRRGEQIFAVGEGHGLVYILRSGCIRLVKPLPDGRTIAVGILGPNSIFTQEIMSDGLASGTAAEAIVESTISIVDADELAGLIAETPDLAAAAVAGMTRRFTELQTLIEQILVRDTAVRLATTLLTLARTVGEPADEGQVHIALRVSHQELANLIGANRVTVTRKVDDLIVAGAILHHGRQLIIVSPEKLRAYVEAATDRE